MKYKNHVVYIIVISSLVRILIAATTELGNDEVYYWTYAIQPDWNHFDHPPLVGLFIRLFTFNLSLRDELFIRLTSIIAAAANTWLMYLIGKKIKNDVTGFYASVLYTSSLYSSMIAGLFILPDSPQLFFWVCSIYLMLDIFFYQPGKRNKILLLGLLIGLATMCKVHGIFLWVGAGTFILLFQRDWLKRWQLYAAILISLLIISPIVWWNVNNNFITYSYHGERVTATQGLSAKNFFREIGGEIAYNNPVNYTLYIVTIIAAFSKRSLINTKLKSFFILISLPLIIVVWIIALFNRTFPHWSGPGFTGLMLLCSYVLGEKQLKLNTDLLLRISILLIIIFVTIGWITINFLPFTLGKQNHQELGKGDFSLDMFGWGQLKHQFSDIRQKDIATSVMSPHSFIISEKWFPAAHLDFYVAQPLGVTLLGVGPLNNIHKFAWLNRERKAFNLGDDAYFITPSNVLHDPYPLYKKNFSLISKPQAIPVYRFGKLVMIFYIFRMKNCIDTKWNGSYEWRLGK
jgi:4-amino-4-deoxy-L-arabinose transferase-like glycosyltransferase